MSYTAKQLRERLADVPDDELVTGLIYIRKDQYINLGLADEEEREPRPEEWPEIVSRFEEYVGDEGAEGLWSCMRDALDVSSPNPDGEGGYAGEFDGEEES